MFMRKSRQSGRAHVDLVVWMMCLGTLAIVTTPGQSETSARSEISEPTLVAAAADVQAMQAERVLAEAAGALRENSLISASTAR